MSSKTQHNSGWRAPRTRTLQDSITNSVNTLCLDADCLLRSFTSGIETLFAVCPADRGCSITDIKCYFDAPDVPTIARECHESQRQCEYRIEAHNGRIYRCHGDIDPAG